MGKDYCNTLIKNMWWHYSISRIKAYCKMESMAKFFGLNMVEPFFFFFFNGLAQSIIVGLIKLYYVAHITIIIPSQKTKLKCHKSFNQLGMFEMWNYSVLIGEQKSHHNSFRWLNIHV